MARGLGKKVPAYRLHKPSQRAVVTLCGKDVYLGAYGTEESRAEYDRAIAEWLAKGRPVVEANRSDPTIDDLVFAYWQHVKGYYVKNGAATSEQGCIKQAVRYVRRLYGKTLAREFGPVELTVVRDAMVKAGAAEPVASLVKDPVLKAGTGAAEKPQKRRVKKAWARSTVNQQISRVKRMFKWATEQKMIPATVFHGLIAVRGLQRGRTQARDPQRIQPVRREQVSAILPHVSKQVAAMIELQLLTGMRPGEVVILRACDLKTGDEVWTYTPQTHKNDHRGLSRSILLGPGAQEVLKPHLGTELSGFVFSPKDAEEARHAKQRRVRRSPLTPSQLARKPKLSVVTTGSGLNLYWFTNTVEWAAMEAEERRAAFADMQRRLQAFDWGYPVLTPKQAKQAGRPPHINAGIVEIAGLMPLPGTWNFRTEHPKLCEEIVVIKRLCSLNMLETASPRSPSAGTNQGDQMII